MMKAQRGRQFVMIDTALAGPLFMLSAALLFTLLTLLIKSLSPEFSVWNIGFYRFGGGLLVLLAIFGRRRNPFKGHNTRLLIVRGCVGSIAFICAVTAIRLLPVSTAMVIFYSFPAFAAIFSYLLYGERIGAMGILCIAVVIGGISILFDFKLSGNLFGQIIALTGGAFAGLTITLIRSLRANNGPVIIYLYLCTMGTLVTLPMFMLNPVFPDTAMEWSLVVGIILSSVVAQLLMNQGFFYCRSWEGGVLMSSEVLFTAVMGIVFLGDPLTLRLCVGGAMVFGSVVALNRLNSS